MNYTAGPMLNREAVPDVAVHPTASGLPPLSETMKKTNDVLTDCISLVDRINSLLANVQEEQTQCKAPIDSMQRASMNNCDLAISLMHKIELALSVLGA